MYAEEGLQMQSFYVLCSPFMLSSSTWPAKSDEKEGDYEYLNCINTSIGRQLFIEKASSGNLQQEVQF